MDTGRALWRRVWRDRIAATAYVGSTRLAYILFSAVPSGAIALELSDAQRGATVAFAAVFVAVATPISYVHCRRMFGPVASLVDASRPPVPSEQRALIRQPALQAGAVIAYWAAAGVALAVGYVTVIEANLWHALLLFSGATLLGLHVAAFVYLLVERTLRPVVARASEDWAAVRLDVVPVHTRFLLAWGFGPGVSILGIAIFLSIRTDAASGDIGRAIWPIVVLALVEGYVLAVLAARSVTEPMAQVRAGMKRILEGDLDTYVPVNSGSEVGLLQIGFNRMAAGLRERERLQQLFRQRVGDEVARQAIEKGADFEGVEVAASVLFVDLIGSTGFTETHRPAEVAATLNALFDAVVRTVDEEGGWVSRFAGDAAVCVFGALGEGDDHADRALRVASALRREIARLAVDQPWLDAGIGVSSGPVLAVDVGSATRFEFTIVGDAANEAARLSDWAKQQESRVLASEGTVSAARLEAVNWVHTSTVALRGKSLPTLVYEPVELAGSRGADAGVDERRTARLSGGGPGSTRTSRASRR